MNNFVQAFSIILPVDDELLNFTLLLFCGKPSRHRNANFTYSIVCKISGIQTKFFNAEIRANYGQGLVLKDCPVIKDKEFIFSNECSRPFSLSIRIEVMSLNADGNLVSSILTVEVKCTLLIFMVSNTRLEQSIKKLTNRLQESHMYSHPSLAAG